MAYDFWENFPVSPSLLPKRLQDLLKPIGLSPQERVEITTLYENDKYGPSYEYVHMLMAAVPDDIPDPLPEFQSSSAGVVVYSTPAGNAKGFAQHFSPSMDGHEYLVASWGNGAWYSYNLAEKVWMALGLSPRCIGNEYQTIVYDDLSLPEFVVAEGAISSEHYWKTLRDISWKISNVYLRRYLWMRGARGVRTFYYEAVINESPELRKLIGKDSYLDLIKVRIRELYKGIPDKEILHAHKFALAQEDISHLDLEEEHIASKVHRLINQLLDVGDNLSHLGDVVGLKKTPEEILKLSRTKIKDEWWRDYPQVRALAQVAPLKMTQPAFLSRCKDLNELYHKIPATFLRKILIEAGCIPDKVEKLASLKLLQGILNVIEDLNCRGESQNNFVGSAKDTEWENRNSAMAPLFSNNDLRISDAHGVNNDNILPSLQNLGFDTARINSGYGYALDFMMDNVIVAFETINASMYSFLER